MVVQIFIHINLQLKYIRTDYARYYLTKKLQGAYGADISNKKGDRHIHPKELMNVFVALKVGGLSKKNYFCVSVPFAKIIFALLRYSSGISIPQSFATSVSKRRSESSGFVINITGIS